MASALGTFMTTLATTWAAAPPPTDGSGSNYAFVDDLIEERGAGRHRQIAWTRPIKSRVVAETPIQLEWEIGADLFLHRAIPAERTQDAFHRAIADELNVLVRSWSGITAWGADVLEAHLVDTDLDDAVVAPKKRAGGVARPLVARVRFNFRVLVREQ